MKFDFGGYATKNDLKCSDGRTIRSGAFKDMDGAKVPLVWQHRHDGIDNVLGHAILENREDGVYAYCVTNDTPAGKRAKEIVLHGDVAALSIFANHLRQNGSDVIHGVIREVSLVLAGANPGAKIDNLQFAHSDGTFEDIEDEAIVYFDDPISLILSHEDSDEDEDEEDDTSSEEAEESEDESDDSGEEDESESETDETEDEEADEEDEIKHADMTVEEIFNTMSEEQRNAVFSIIGEMAGEGEAVPDAEKQFNSLNDAQKNAVYAVIGSMSDTAAEHSDQEGEIMKFNVFDAENETSEFLSHDDMVAIFDEARKSGSGSLKDACLAHGITSIETLFPEAQAVNSTPETISRRMEWVAGVLASCHKSPFSKVKSMAIDITADEARARGYVRGTQKVEEVIEALGRETPPQTIYKLQKLDRDDVIDITDFDVVAWIKAEMRVMLDEEIARAILIGDGRGALAPDKIKEANVRPIWTDNETYTTHVKVDGSLTGSARAKAFIEACIRARKFYKGSGAPKLYVGQDLLTEMRLIRDNDGYRLYKNDQELADELRVSGIVEIELFDNNTREVDGKELELGGIIVNLADYNIGATRGGEVTMFDDFDLNFNKYEYLLETRISGALIRPLSAIAIEFGEITSDDSDDNSDDNSDEGGN